MSKKCEEMMEYKREKHCELECEICGKLMKAKSIARHIRDKHYQGFWNFRNFSFGSAANCVTTVWVLITAALVFFVIRYFIYFEFTMYWYP